MAHAVLLLDEITVDLDLLSRRNFLEFLKRETEGRVCTIVYATHILDGLAGWPSHLVHMHLGRVREWGPVGDFDLGGYGNTGNSRLGELVLGWLGEDLRERGPRNGGEGVGSQMQSYPDLEGRGGYGSEKREG